MKPLIGITGRQFPYRNVVGSPAVLADAMVDCVLVDYVDAVLASGGIPIHLPLNVAPSELLERLDGLVLSGGADIDPRHYGRVAEPGNDTYEPVRDRFELSLAQLAIENSVPTLGICRGIQLLNVAAGGTLLQDVPEHARYEVPPDGIVHTISIDPGSIPSGAYGPSHEVNSFHHQIVDDIGVGARVVANAEDGHVEAIEFDGKPIVGIQWHPEMFRQRDPIFDWLVDTATAPSSGA